MKLTKDLIEFIETVVKTGALVDIENVIIDAKNGAVRGIDENRSVVLFQDSNIPEFPINAIGLSRGEILLNRLQLVKDRAGFEVEAEMVILDDNEYIKSLHMKCDDIRVNYRCANPAAIKAPKQINDTIIHHVQLNAETVSVLQRAYGAMGTETVTIVGGENGVAFELEDISEDTMRHEFASDSTQLGESTFAHKYPIKTLLALFKQNPDNVFEIGEKGILRIAVNDLNIYVLPQV